MVNVLVPENTAHKGTSKRHKTDEKRTHFAVYISPSALGFFVNELFQCFFERVMDVVG